MPARTRQRDTTGPGSTRRDPPSSGMAAAAVTGSAVAAAASMCSVGELRAGEEGSGSDLAGDDAGAAQRIEVLPPTDGGLRRRMNPKKAKILIFFRANIHLTIVLKSYIPTILLKIFFYNCGFTVLPLIKKITTKKELPLFYWKS